MRPIPFLASLARPKTAGLVLLGSALGGLLWAATASPQTTSKAYTITIKEEKEKVAEPILPVEPGVAINLSSGPNMQWGLKTQDGKRLTFSDFSAQTHFKIDGAMIQPGGGQM